MKKKNTDDERVTIIGLDSDTKRDFKIKCVMNKVSMNQVCIDLIKGYTYDNTQN